MAEYLELEKVLDDRNIITVQTKEYGSIEVIPFDTITDIELADVYPQKHGRWIPQGDDMWLCSNCKENIIFSMHESDRTEKQRYCCKCGARMDGGIDG